MQEIATVFPDWCNRLKYHEKPCPIQSSTNFSKSRAWQWSNWFIIAYHIFIIITQICLQVNRYRILSLWPWNRITSFLISIPTNFDSIHMYVKRFITKDKQKFTSVAVTFKQGHLFLCSILTNFVSLCHNKMLISKEIQNLRWWLWNRVMCFFAQLLET